ncbi:CAP domain-containing protein [Streptomyces sp. NPDC007896]|uniref:CAP domain-containing protein n=1 Tax=Streptomyces sp. NPDC007896 TaxID=3364784 RepID=UPI0036E91016
MKRLAMTAVAVATAAALFGPLAPARAAAVPPSVPSAGPGHAAFQRQYYPNVDYITCEINKERIAQELSPLLISDRASDVSRSHAIDMANIGRLTGTGSDGRDQRARLADADIYSNTILEFMFSGYNHDGYFADMATDPRPDNAFYRALMDRDVVAIGLGYDRTFWDVNLLGYHRRLNARSAICTQP